MTAGIMYDDEFDSGTVWIAAVHAVVGGVFPQCEWRRGAWRGARGSQPRRRSEVDSQ